MRNENKKVPSIKNYSHLEIRFPDLKDDELDFIKKCLVINPAEREPAEQLLNHKYLASNESLDNLKLAYSDLKIKNLNNNNKFCLASAGRLSDEESNKEEE